MNNENIPLASPEISQPTRESILPTTEEPQQDIPKKNSKIPKVAIYILTSIILLALGAFSFWFYQEKTVKKSISDPSLLPTAPPAIEQTKDLIEWATYVDEKIDYLKFKYPEGGTVNVLKDDKSESNYALEMVYKDLKLDVNTIMGGIGGGSSNPSSPYTIIYGNYHEGIGKSIDSESYPDETKISYFRFYGGGLQFGNFLIHKSNFIFKIPNELLSEYEWIADVIACSVWDLEPDKQIKFPKAYVTNNNLIGLKDDKTHYPITFEQQEENEKVEKIVTNPNGNFLLIDTFEETEPNRREWAFLYIFDLRNNSLVAINNNQKQPNSSSSVFWLNNSEFVYGSDEGNLPPKFYKINIEDKTKTEVTQEQFNQYQNASQKRYDLWPSAPDELFLK